MCEFLSTLEYLALRPTCKIQISYVNISFTQRPRAFQLRLIFRMTIPVTRSFGNITTPRLKLQPVKVSDAADLFYLRAHEKIQKYRSVKLGWLLVMFLHLAESRNVQRYDTIHEVIELLEICISDPLSFRSTVSVLAVSPTIRKASQIIGVIGISPRHLISYEFDPSFWGNGFATEALHCFIERYFCLFPDNRFVYALVDIENVASTRVLEKCGFEIYRAAGQEAIHEVPEEQRTKDWLQYVYEKSNI
jgi:RimJ/RimL family protein N-acetyltransferase